MSLGLRLGQQMDSGRTGFVYEVTHEMGPAVPPLVVKITVGDRVRSLLHEAAVYEEMESLQGLVVAHCYGYFELERQGDNAHALSRVVEALQEQTARRLEAARRREEESNSDSGEWKETSLGHVAAAYDRDRDLTQVLAVLVLERLGPSIPLTQGWADPKHPNFDEYVARVRVQEDIDALHRMDIKAMYSDLAELGILHGDVRYCHIRQTLDAGHLPPYSCQTYHEVVMRRAVMVANTPAAAWDDDDKDDEYYSQKSTHQRLLKIARDALPPGAPHRHRYRLIDFELATKVDLKMNYFYYHQDDFVESVTNGMKYSHIVEPWDHTP
jgi:hypothetical protein